MLQSYLFVLLSYVENDKIGIKIHLFGCLSAVLLAECSILPILFFLVNGWSKGIPCEKT